MWSRCWYMRLFINDVITGGGGGSNRKNSDTQSGPRFWRTFNYISVLSLNLFWRKQVVHRYLQNNICYFRSPISPWRGPQWNSLFWAFFLDMVYIVTIPLSEKQPFTFGLFFGRLKTLLNPLTYCALSHQHKGRYTRSAKKGSQDMPCASFGHGSENKRLKLFS